MKRTKPRYVVAKLDAYPQVGAIHGIIRGQKLRVVMDLPASKTTYERDAVVLYVGDGLPPLTLWQTQVAEWQGPEKP